MEPIFELLVSLQRHKRYRNSQLSCRGPPLVYTEGVVTEVKVGHGVRTTQTWSTEFLELRAPEGPPSIRTLSETYRWTDLYELQDRGLGGGEDTQKVFKELQRVGDYTERRREWKHNIKR